MFYYVLWIYLCKLNVCKYVYGDVTAPGATPSGVADHPAAPSRLSPASSQVNEFHGIEQTHRLYFRLILNYTINQTQIHSKEVILLFRHQVAVLDTNKQNP